MDSTGTLSFTCTGTGTDTLSIIIMASGICSPREMLNGSAALRYDIFNDSARSLVWCEGAQRLDIPMDYSTFTTQTKTLTLYGRVSSAQTPAYATYSATPMMQLKQGNVVLRTSTLTVTGSVAPTCSISAGTLGFATYSAAAAKDASATVTVNCTNTAPYQLSLGGGNNLSGTTRRLAGPSGGYLDYLLYSNSGRTTAWGDGTGLGAKVSGTGSGSNQSLTVYGRIPAGQDPRPGSYTDSVFVTVDY